MEAFAASEQSATRTVAASPTVSLVVPFAGSHADATHMLANLGAVRLRPGDEAIVADNTRDGVLESVSLPTGWRVVAARGEGSPARARNAGALAARGEWLLFVDSDCRAAPDLIERHLELPSDAHLAIVGGAIVGAPEQTATPARYARSRGHLDQSVPLANGFLPYVLTANALVRRSAWRSLGGFLEGIANAEDVDFAWRAQRAGWRVLYNPQAVVEHEHRESLRALWRQTAVARASAIWVHRRWPEAPLPRVPWPSTLGRSAVAAPVFLLTGRPQLAAMKVLDALVVLAMLAGRARSNRASAWPASPVELTARRPLQVWCDAFPVLSETFVANEARELQALGHPVQIVARARPQRPALGIHDLGVRYVEDYTRYERAVALARLLVRHPLRCLRDRLARSRWAREETPARLRELAPAIVALERQKGAQIHAHFAGPMALSALRASRIVGRPWSLTAHAYDIYQHRTNLAEKIRSADVVTSGCAYTVSDLAAIAGPGHADRVHEIVMGVDPERFRRTSPQPDPRTVIGIGRLVEKKGFVHLLHAAADPALAGMLDQLVLVGDGPLAETLREEARRIGLGERVRFTGPLEPEEILRELEAASVLAMPCVVASDGDRDSMPVVVKEAMAMEVPVVASDEVGLPELVRPPFGRVVPPADPAALAAALADILSRSPAQRAELGRAGREHVAAHAHVRTWTARLSALLDPTAAGH